jgi:hypothetical protein
MVENDDVGPRESGLAAPGQESRIAWAGPDEVNAAGLCCDLRGCAVRQESMCSESTLRSSIDPEQFGWNGQLGLQEAACAGFDLLRPMSTIPSS